MINLISQRAKKNLWNEYRIRLGIIILFALFLVQLFAALFFFPTFLALQKSTNSLAREVASKKLLTPEKTSDIAAELAEIKAELALLRPSGTSSAILPSELLADILSTKPAGLMIDSIMYQREKEGATIQFSGIASMRGDITEFKKTLSENKRVIIVNGADYLLKKTSVPFSLTLKVK